MSEQDFVVNVNSVVPNGSQINRKPAHLVILENHNKAKLALKFIALDRPELLNNFINVKGFFSELSEDEIIKDFSSILTTTNKDAIIEMLFPVNKVVSIRNLVFKAK